MCDQEKHSQSLLDLVKTTIRSAPFNTSLDKVSLR